jgi:hypothetical protein
MRECLFSYMFISSPRSVAMFSHAVLYRWVYSGSPSHAVSALALSLTSTLTKHNTSANLQDPAHCPRHNVHREEQDACIAFLPRKERAPRKRGGKKVKQAAAKKR